VNGSDTAVVSVIDNTTGTTLLSCTVDSTTVNHCFDSSDTGSAAAGDNLEVEIGVNGTSGDNAFWRVTFRY
jgi:hypothetical protein